MSLLPGQPLYSQTPQTSGNGSGIFGNLFNTGLEILKGAILKPSTTPQTQPVESKMPVWAWVAIGFALLLLFGKKLLK